MHDWWRSHSLALHSSNIFLILKAEDSFQIHVARQPAAKRPTNPCRGSGHASGKRDVHTALRCGIVVCWWWVRDGLWAVGEEGDGCCWLNLQNHNLAGGKIHNARHRRSRWRCANGDECNCYHGSDRPTLEIILRFKGKGMFYGRHNKISFYN